jgi:hypothetical protein
MENVDFDAELMFVSAALHDLGLVPQFDAGAPFEQDSATAAHEFTNLHGWPASKSAIAGQAIVLHIAPDVTHATAVDVTGRRLDELSAATVTQVLSDYPRLGFPYYFGKLLAYQARQKPHSRAAQRVEGSLLERLAACALDHPSPGS